MLINEVIALPEKDEDFEAGLLAKIQDVLTVAMSRDIKKVSTEKFKGWIKIDNIWGTIK